MARLYIPIALPGSGKSTLARALLPDAHWVSTDEIRQDPALFPGGYVYSKESNAQVFDVFHRRIESWLTHVRQAAIADATNLKPHHRATLLDIAHRTGADVHYLAFTNVAQAVLRNARRKGWARVPDEAMLGLVAQYEVALKDILLEPYDTLTYIERVE